MTPYTTVGFSALHQNGVAIADGLTFRSLCRQAVILSGAGLAAMRVAHERVGSDVALAVK
jgi:hypothetical protein